MSIEDRLRHVFSDVFGIDAESVPTDASPHTVDGWDSIAHLNLLFALEGEFDIQFELEAIPELVTFDAIRDRVEKLVEIQR